MGDLHKEKTFISAVVYIHNDDNALDFFKAINDELESRFLNFEYVVIDDAGIDNTIAEIKNWARKTIASITIIHMSLYHGVEYAMNAGIDAAIGDFIYEFDSVQMPYDVKLISDAYENSLKGNDIVCVCPKHINSRFFYKIFNANSGSIYKLQTDAFRLVTRRAINRVHAAHSYMPYRKAAYAASGLKVSMISFDCSISNNQRSKISLAIDSLALYTNAGYKISVCITLLMMFVSIAELIYTVVIYCIGKPIAGWTTTMLVVSFGFLGLFFVLSIVIKYLSLNIDMSFRRLKYLVESVERVQK